MFMAGDVCGDAYGGNPLNGCFLEGGMALENGTNPSGGVGDFFIKDSEFEGAMFGVEVDG